MHASLGILRNEGPRLWHQRTQCCAAQFYADTTDFTGLPDPSLNNTVAPAAAGESDGDQYVALNQRTSFEPLFAKYGVDVSLLSCPHMCLSCTCVAKSC